MTADIFVRRFVVRRRERSIPVGMLPVNGLGVPHKKVRIQRADKERAGRSPLIAAEYTLTVYLSKFFSISKTSGCVGVNFTPLRSSESIFFAFAVIDAISDVSLNMRGRPSQVYGPAI